MIVKAGSESSLEEKPLLSNTFISNCIKDLRRKVLLLRGKLHKYQTNHARVE